MSSAAIVIGAISVNNKMESWATETIRTFIVIVKQYLFF